MVTQTEKKKLREMIERLNNFKEEIDTIIDSVDERCESVREKSENSPKIEKYEEEGNYLSSLDSEVDGVIESIEWIIDGVGF
jgi:flagellar biosynthesis chaperone FliJ